MRLLYLLLSYLFLPIHRVLEFVYEVAYIAANRLRWRSTFFIAKLILRIWVKAWLVDAYCLSKSIGSDDRIMRKSVEVRGLYNRL